jgi:hypothetical protein
MDKEDKTIVLIIVAVVLIGLGLIFLGMWGLPKYDVWRKELSGQAQLKEAEWNRQIQIREAEANLESEILNAKSEIERAKGMAEAIRIEGGSLTTEYIQYLWVRQNIFNDKTTIYIPTEANLPVLEALRLDK